MFVYILFSDKSLRYQVGQTADIEKRLKKHNQGNVQSTKFGIHWKLVLKIEAANRSEALILEKKVKKRGAKRYIDNQFGVQYRKCGIDSTRLSRNA